MKFYSHHSNDMQTDSARDVQSCRDAINTQPQSGRTSFIVNADDWGRDTENTSRALDCILHGAVSSVSAMVFMQDSEHAALLAQQHNIDTGLHLNLTTPFSAPYCSSRLIECQSQIARFLCSNRLAQVIYHPFLASAFEYVVRMQLDEYERIYGVPAGRIDGHHHMHLCANVLFQKLLPKGTILRRNFTFAPGEKIWINLLYRHWQDRILLRKHHATDYFFALAPLDNIGRMHRIAKLAGRFSIEIETHPVNADEYRYLLSGELLRTMCLTDISHRYDLGSCNNR
jgi:predicted glycoside hydrolase/deacetylase ChbG (UPF0249 family)